MPRSSSKTHLKPLQTHEHPPAVEISEEALDEAHDVEARVKVQDGLLTWRYKVRSPVFDTRFTANCTEHIT